MNHRNVTCHAARVDSVTNFQHVSSTADEVRVRDLLPAGQTLTAEVERLIAEGSQK